VGRVGKHGPEHGLLDVSLEEGMDKRVGFPQHLTTRWDDFDRRSPYMRRQWPKEEPFEERRRRVHSVSPAYASSWAQFMSELIDADTGEATYYAYAFWTKAPWGESFDEIVFSVSGGGKYDSCGGRKSDSRQHGLAAG